MGPEPINEDDVGLLPHFKRSNLVRHPERTRRVHRDHLENLARRQHVGIAEVEAMVPRRLEHMAEHVIAAVGGNAVGAEHHGDAGVEQFSGRIAATH